MKARSFGVEKFKALLVAGTFTVLANYIVRLSDSIIVGQLIGPDALAGVSLVGPCLSFVAFLGGMVATGVGTKYSIAMGRCNRDRARQFFMQGVWSALMFGGAFSLVLACCGREILDFYGATGAARTYASDYLAWIWPLALIESFEVLLIALGYADGDSKLCMLSYAVVFAANFVVSVVGVKLGFGTAGCAVGSVIADALGILVMAAHFFRPACTFRPVRFFSFRDTLSICGASFGDSAAFLCDGLLFLFLNKFAVAKFGSEILPVVGVATSIWGFMVVFDGVGVAIQPLVTAYFGERNSVAIRRVMDAAMKVSLAEGALAMTVALLSPGLLVALVGIDDPTLYGQSLTAVRLISFGFVAKAFAGLFNSYYMFVDRSLFAGLLTFLSYLIFPTAAIAVGSFGGACGLWIGLSAGAVGGVVMVALLVVAVRSWAAFPLLLPRDRDAKLWVFGLDLEPEAIVEVSRKVGRLSGVPMRAALLVEEVFMAVRDRNLPRRVTGEVVVDLNDGVELTLRDDGQIFDITDVDQRIASLRTFLVASMMCRHGDKQNLVTVGFNRNVFRF